MDIRKNLLTLAWIIEISVVGITSTIFQDEFFIYGFEGLGDYFLVFLPFLFVSITTLLRIPLIISYRNVQTGVMKLLKTLFLIVISFMFFEAIASATERQLISVGLTEFSNLEITFIYFLVALLTLLGPIIAYLSIYKLKGKD